jgi:uncharacterized protein (TIGR02265 family)
MSQKSNQPDQKDAESKLADKSEQVSEVANPNTYKVRQTQFEALIKGFDLEHDVATLAELKEASGYDHLRPRLEYPDYIIKDAIIFLAKKFYPHTAPAETMRQIARKHALGYVNGTIVGRIAFAVSGKVSVMKMLHSICNLNNDIASYKDRIVIEHEPNHATYKVPHDQAIPTYTIGLVTTLLELAGAKNIKITYTVLGKNNIDYDITWQD